MAFLAVGRSTFDIDSGAELCALALAKLRELDTAVLGDQRVHLTPDDVTSTIATWQEHPEALIIAFGTFADATLAVTAAQAIDDDVPIVLWSFPEHRSGKRLRRNSLCGANLAAFSLAGRNLHPTGVHGRPTDVEIADQLRAALRGWVEPHAGHSQADSFTAVEHAAASAVAHRLAEAHIGIVGDANAGFEPCDLIDDPLPIGTTFQRMPLSDLFEVAAHTETPVSLPSGMTGIEKLEPVATGRSLQLRDALSSLSDQHDWDAIALRCWPECFTQWGGAACGPLSMLGESGLPAACEADAFGALTLLMLSEITERPAFLADLVDFDAIDNTAVFWHCGVAPASMADPARPVQVGDHPNRHMPLAMNFGLRPGPVTITRLSRSHNRLRLVVGSGEMMEAPAPFIGTSGVVTMDTPVQHFHRVLISEGLEHHFGVAYGDHRRAVQALALVWGIEVIDV
jgi:L-fucose isomerase-like protein